MLKLGIKRLFFGEISQLDMVFANNAKFPRCSKTPEVK